MNRSFQNLEKLKRESVRDYDHRLNDLPPMVGGYAYFIPGNYDRQRQRFGVFLVWNDLFHKHLKEDQPAGGYYIQISEKYEAYFLNKFSGMPVYVKLISQGGKVYPKELFVLKGNKHFKLIFNGCEVMTPEDVCFMEMDAASALTPFSGSRSFTVGSGLPQYLGSGTMHFAGSGLRLGGSGYRFSTSGLRLGGSGYRFSTSGLRLGGSGYRFSTSGLRLGGSGYRFSTSGLRLGGSGYRFSTSGLRLGGSGYRFSTSGLRLGGSGYRFSTSGLRLGGSGYRFTTSGLRVGGSSNWFGTSGTHFSGSFSAYGFTTSGLKLTGSGFRYVGSKLYSSSRVLWINGSGRRNSGNRFFVGSSYKELKKHTFDEAFYLEKDGLYIRNDAPSSYLEVDKIYGIGNLGYGLDLI